MLVRQSGFHLVVCIAWLLQLHPAENRWNWLELTRKFIVHSTHLQVNTDSRTTGHEDLSFSSCLIGQWPQILASHWSKKLKVSQDSLLRRRLQSICTKMQHYKWTHFRYCNSSTIWILISDTLKSYFCFYLKYLKSSKEEIINNGLDLPTIYIASSFQ